MSERPTAGRLSHRPAGDKPVLGAEEVRATLLRHLPVGHSLSVEQVAAHGLEFSVAPADLSLRPGGTVSGPALFAFADITAFLSLNAYLGRSPSAVLTSSSISFLEATRPGRLRALVTAERIGRRSAVMTVRIQDAQTLPVSLATLHFAFPAKEGRPSTPACEPSVQAAPGSADRTE